MRLLITARAYEIILVLTIKIDNNKYPTRALYLLDAGAQPFSVTTEKPGDDVIYKGQIHKTKTGMQNTR